MEFLSSIDVDLIKGMARDLVTDKNLSTGLLFRRLISNSYNESSGVSVPVYMHTELSGVRGDHSLKDVADTKGEIAVGDSFYVVNASAIGISPGLDDMLLVKQPCRGGIQLVSLYETVTGLATDFIADDVQGQDILYVQGETGVIQSITNLRTLVLSAGWAGLNVGNIFNFGIYRPYMIKYHITDPLSATMKLTVRKPGGH